MLSHFDFFLFFHSKFSRALILENVCQDLNWPGVKLGFSEGLVRVKSGFS